MGQLMKQQKLLEDIKKKLDSFKGVGEKYRELKNVGFPENGP